MDDTPSSLWRHRSFLQIWGADSLFDMARQSSIVVVPLIGALTLDATPFEMGVLGAAATAPSLLISLIAGVWVDRFPRHVLLWSTALLRCLLMGSVPILWWTGALSIWLLVGISFLSGSVTLVFDLARQAWLPALVGRSRLLEANGRMQASRSIAQMAGPTLGGATAGWLAPPLAMFIDSISSLSTAAISSRIAEPENNRQISVDNTPTWRLAYDGMRFALGNPILRATIGASGVTSLFGYVFLAVYVLYMANWLDLSSFEIGLVFALGGLGALLGSVLAAPAARRFGIGAAIIGGWLLFGLGGLPIPLAIMVPAYALVLVIISEFFQWMVLTVTEVNELSLRQSITPDHYLGRVAATFRFTVNGLVPVGSLLGGILGTLVGVPATLLIGVGGMLLAFVWVWRSPIRRISSHPEAPVDLIPAHGE